MSKVNIPWPTKKDNPFKGGSYCPTQANVDWLLQHFVFPIDLTISEGFREAADKIVEDLETGRNFGHPDKFLFPVVYLYRHAFELCLKCIIRNGIDHGVLTEDPKVENILKRHNLHKLWGKARYVLEEHWPHGDKETPDNAERVLLEFHRFFPSGQECRYAEDIEGVFHLDNVPQIVDLVNLKEVAGNLYTFLSSCVMGLEEECGQDY